MPVGHAFLLHYIPYYMPCSSLSQNRLELCLTEDAVDEPSFQRHILPGDISHVAQYLNSLLGTEHCKTENA